MPRITLERNGVYIHCAPQQLDAVLPRLQAAASPGGQAGAFSGNASGLLTHASLTAHECLNFLTSMFPIYGAATRLLGTALRAPVVRDGLKDVHVRGEPMLKVLGWISAADDAARHITP